MPHFQTKCSFCKKEFIAYQRPNRPHQKDWYCCLEHYRMSGHSRGRPTKELKKRIGTYDRERQELKNVQIKQFGKNTIHDSTI